MAEAGGRGISTGPGTTQTAFNMRSTLDLSALWDFSNPALSEQRFKAALLLATGQDALILQTQIARSHGLRRDFNTARQLLAAMRPQLEGASAEVQVRHRLEWGRTYASGRHPPQAMDEAAKSEARLAWQQALDMARQAALDELAIDALHMFAFIDTTPAQQQQWAEQALAVVLASQQPAAQRWEASVRNNLGLALQLQDRHNDALVQYQQALALRQKAGHAQNTLVAGYMVARSLRLLGRLEEALPMQQRLLQDSEALGAVDPHVLDELVLLHRAQGNISQASAAAQRAAQVRGSHPP